MLKKNYTNDVLTAVFLNLLGFAEPFCPKKKFAEPLRLQIKFAESLWFQKMFTSLYAA